MILRAPFGVPARDVAGGTVRAPRLKIDEHSLAFFAALLALALVAEVLVLRPLLITNEEPVAGIDVVFGLVGGSFAVSGLVAWRRRPDSRTGVLMTGTGFAFLLSPLLRQLEGALAYTVWSLTVDLWIFFFIPVLLTLLTRGYLRPGPDRLLVAAYAIPLVLLQVVWLLFAEPEDGENLLLAFPDEDIAHVLDRTQRSMLVAVLVVTLLVIAIRWWRASAPRRRALLPSVAGRADADAVHGAAPQRPDQRRALGAAAVGDGAVAADRAARLPVRPAALAPGPRGARQPVQQHRRLASQASCSRRWRGRSATPISGSATGAPRRGPTPTPTASP